ncbi:nucleotidyltransferase family protein [Caldivirga sp. UBA161]|uniref:nucleotidyltransferase family protein n=1 Tax=Caldivirga sp. UBA161 TaxID=1915569 RepID=UPI0025BC0794|nr:nucleotidyltransferase family protein [Caldivirga sp. UBA161]
MAVFGVVLAAGKGERLRPLTLYVPKPLMPIPGGRLAMQDAVERLLPLKPVRIYVITHYMAELILDAVKRMNLTYNGLLEAIIHDKLLGTAGHLYFLGNLVKDDDIVVVENGDVIADVNMVDAVNFHMEKNLDMTIIGYRAGFQLRYGVLETEGYEVKAWVEKPTINLTISTGNYIIKGKLLRLLNGGFIDMNDYVNLIIRRGGRVGAYLVNKFVDIGTVDDYLKLWCQGK